MQFIYKILTPHEWEQFQGETVFLGSLMDLKDGFIHCSQEDQYPAIKEKFFKDQSLVILLQLDTQKLPEGTLKIESNRPGGTEYPHVYGSIPLDAVTSWSTLA
jgi:uncharacterized protein (DUF952 family)